MLPTENLMLLMSCGSPECSIKRGIGYRSHPSIISKNKGCVNIEPTMIRNTKSFFSLKLRNAKSLTAKIA